MCERESTPAPDYCGRGQHSCIYLVWGSTSFLLTYEQFFMLVGAVNGKRCLLEEENELEAAMAETHRNLFPMRPVQDTCPEFIAQVHSSRRIIFTEE